MSDLMVDTRVLRFQVPVNGEWTHISVPKHQILHVGCRFETTVEFWVRESTMGTELRAFRAYGTGEPTPNKASYEGTAIAPGGKLVWHLMSMWVNE